MKLDLLTIICYLLQAKQAKKTPQISVLKMKMDGPGKIRKRITRGKDNIQKFSKRSKTTKDKSTEFDKRYECKEKRADAYHADQKGKKVKHTARRYQLRVKNDRELLYEFFLSEDKELFVMSTLQNKKDKEKNVEGSCGALWTNEIMGEFLKKHDQDTPEQLKYVTAESIQNQDTLVVYNDVFHATPLYKSAREMPVILRSNDKTADAFHVMHDIPLVKPVMRMFHEYNWKKTITEIRIQGKEGFTLVLD